MKETRIEIRVSEDIKAAWKARADACGLDLSEFVRACVASEMHWTREGDFEEASEGKDLSDPDIYATDEKLRVGRPVVPYLRPAAVE